MHMTDCSTGLPPSSGCRISRQRKPLNFHRGKLLFSVFSCFWTINVCNGEMNAMGAKSPVQRPQIVVSDDSISFHAPEKTEIRFIPGKQGSIFFGNVDVKSLASLDSFHNLSANIRQLKTILTECESRYEARYSGLLEHADFVQKNIEYHEEHKDNVKHFLDPKGELETLTTIRAGYKSSISRINELQSRLQQIVGHLEEDNCASSPCKNGGTCISLFEHFQCLCAKEFHGQTCEELTNPCDFLKDTDEGCQNNGTCVNEGTGFKCDCLAGYHGQLCQWTSNTCEDGHELCGPGGHCITTEKDGKAGHRCICFAGYELNNKPDDQYCVDVDECATNQHRCYAGVNCTNTPGGYECGDCPTGYKGNGVHCADIDECRIRTRNTCSKNPPVTCNNTVGSYICGSCPEGYVGDGHKCTLKKHVLCKTGWAHFNKSCYKVLTLNEAVTEVVAEGKCERENAGIATICSQEENDHIKKLVIDANAAAGANAVHANSAWFGLRVDKIRLGGNFARWYPPGQFCPFANWQDGKPDNEANLSDCTAMDTRGEWDDYPCEGYAQWVFRLVICEAPEGMDLDSL